jgi:tetratricopeptide (TPR) repeat protein
MMGKVKDAFTSVEKAIELAPGLVWAYGLLGSFYAVSGKKEEAVKVIKKLEEWGKKRFISAIPLSQIYFYLGQLDKSIECLNKAFEQKDPVLIILKNLPELRELISEPRIDALLAKINLDK